jgi:hypothetical protein
VCNVSEVVILRDRHWEVEHGLGQLVIVEVSNPLVNPLPSLVSHAVLASWLDQREPVGMFVTVFQRQGNGRDS